MRILVALPPSGDVAWAEEALAVFPTAGPLDLVLVSALDVPRPPLTSPGRHARRMYWAAVGAQRAETRRAAERAAESLAQALAPRAGIAATRILDSRPVPAILEAARAWSPDLILTGSSGRGSISRLILGSVSEEVARLAPCPVLVAKRRVVRLERVLAATDGSLHAEAALRFLGSLALPETAEVRVCAVSEQPPASPLSALSGRGKRRAALLLVLETERRAAAGAVAKARAALGALGCRLQTSLRAGDAARELADEVDRWVPDLLVLGARGRTTGPETPLGSVAEGLLRGAPCPTLLVRA